MRWFFFAGACFLTGAALLPHAPAWTVIGGMVIAGLVLLIGRRAG